jgi:hypothetical protein
MLTYPAIRIGPSALLGLLRLTWSPAQTGDEAVACTLRPVQRWSTEGFIFTDDTFVIDAGFYCGDPAVIMKKCQTIARD